MALTKITNDLLDLGSDTGALGLPKGTEAQRPSNPVEGTLRHNSEIDKTKLETYNGTEWRKINAFVAAYEINYLVVAGGGSAHFGGGGAGGLLSSTVITNELLTITVGAGGGDPSTNRSIAHPGSNSSIIGNVSVSITSIGGGSGGDDYTQWSKFGGPGGSGGGGGLQSNTYGAVCAGGPGTTGQGNAGGSGVYNGTPLYGGGGGGAGAAGSNQNAGNGLVKTIISTTLASAQLVGEVSAGSVFYAGGGGGVTRSNPAGVRGIGGGGAGGAEFATGGNGNTNTGGGGGGFVGQGGSGVVILRMPTANYSGTITGNPTVTTDGTDTILIYKSSGTYTA